MSIDTVRVAPCSLCSGEHETESLIDMAGYPVCRACLERASREVGPPPRRVYKVREGKQIAGVCGGLADHFNFDRQTLRVVALMGMFLTGFVPLIAAYLIMAFSLPTEP